MNDSLVGSEGGSQMFERWITSVPEVVQSKVSMHARFEHIVDHS
jgi:hypothetical protein